jgi:DNA-binding transcriptional regulator YiaG
MVAMEDVKDLPKLRRLVETGVARAIREDAELSLAEMAAPVQVHRTTILRWERGERRPRGAAAIRYLRVLEELTTR